ncbi:MAG: phosphatidylglycerophosphatase A [Arcobacteraceae bacterium]|jgi:phosphatidylglycerophosphatase A|nr:phosphatidylglycerophosphatase A [Arcobacteraceae bacterium]MDY0365635.1 phosphatidylglycerophosphatase A [Arcobacteraceae bacterium]
MRKIFLTLFYSGLSPKAPGTAGSLVALLLGWIMLYLSSATTLFLLTILISIVAVKVINQYEEETQTHDNSQIVIDELAGMWLCMSIIANSEYNLFYISILGFIYFRILDITKPSIIGKIDKHTKGGLGVMGDDIVAGFFAGILSLLTFRFLFFIL